MQYSFYYTNKSSFCLPKAPRILEEFICKAREHSVMLIMQRRLQEQRSAAEREGAGPPPEFPFSVVLGLSGAVVSGPRPGGAPPPSAGKAAMSPFLPKI